MAATTFQKIAETKGGIQRRWVKKQARGHQILHGFGSPNGATKEEHEVLPNGSGPAKHDPGLPVVRRNATKHRLGQRMARLHPVAGGSPNVKCPQSTFWIANQKPSAPYQDHQTPDSSRLCLVPRKTPNDGIKIGRAVHGTKQATYPDRV